MPLLEPDAVPPLEPDAVPLLLPPPPPQPVNNSADNTNVDAKLGYTFFIISPYW
jgi:hypothetical protein